MLKERDQGVLREGCTLSSEEIAGYAFLFESKSVDPYWNVGNGDAWLNQSRKGVDLSYRRDPIP